MSFEILLWLAPGPILASAGPIWNTSAGPHSGVCRNFEGGIKA